MVYVVVGEWGGLVEQVHAFKTRNSASKKEKEIKKEYSGKLAGRYAKVATYEVTLHQ